LFLFLGCLKTSQDTHKRQNLCTHCSTRPTTLPSCRNAAPTASTCVCPCRAASLLATLSASSSRTTSASSSATIALVGSRHLSRQRGLLLSQRWLSNRSLCQNLVPHDGQMPVLGAKHRIGERTPCFACWCACKAFTEPNESARPARAHSVQCTFNEACGATSSTVGSAVDVSQDNRSTYFCHVPSGHSRKACQGSALRSTPLPGARCKHSTSFFTCMAHRSGAPLFHSKALRESGPWVMTRRA
jgi:hypothetical protein